MPFIPWILSIELREFRVAKNHLRSRNLGSLCPLKLLIWKSPLGGAFIYIYTYIFRYKPSILGYHHLRKHPYGFILPDIYADLWGNDSQVDEHVFEYFFKWVGQPTTKATWWFHIYICLFSPRTLGKNEPILTHTGQLGWNHQLDP